MPCVTEDAQRFSGLIHECLIPTKSGERRPLPIVLLWAPARSGKSEMLEQVHKQFYRGRPAVHRRSDQPGNQRPYEVAVQLAYYLGRRVERFGRLKFPRLFLGVTAIRGPIELGESVAARKEMIRRTVPDRRLLKQWTRDTSDVLLDTVAADQMTRVFTGLVLSGVLTTLETVPLLRGRGLQWYGHGLDMYYPDPVDALVELAAWNAEGRQGLVDEVLCRAFLADLRDGCSNRFFQLYDRNVHCLALLDDAESPAVHGFLEIVAAQRKTDWDPLLLVAASSRRFHTARNQNPAECRIEAAGKASYTDWIDNRNVRDGWGARYPITLGGLTEPEATRCFAPRAEGHVARLREEGIDVTGVLGHAENAVMLARQLTGGHVGGLALVLRAMTRERVRAGAQHVDVRGLLGWPADNDVPLAEMILHHVLGTWEAEMHDVLLRCAAAPDLGDTVLTRVLQGEPPHVRQMILDFRSRDTWVRHPPARGRVGPPTLHPFARRALLYRLANPRNPDEPTWNDVHERLRQIPEPRSDMTSSMYHALALGRVSEVSETLSGLFTKQHVRIWYQTLLTVTKAPLENPAQPQEPERHGQWPADGAHTSHPVSTQLVSALQRHSDPLRDPRRELRWVVAHELDTLAGHAPEEGLVFLSEIANDFRNFDGWPTQDETDEGEDEEP